MKEVELADKNLKANFSYLLESSGLDIETLADLIGVDVVTLGLLYLNGEYSGLSTSHKFLALIEIGNYFAVPISEILYTDIRREELLSADWFAELQREYKEGIRANRLSFNKNMLGEYPYKMNPDDEVEWQRHNAWVIHSTTKKKQQFDNVYKRSRQ